MLVVHDLQALQRDVDRCRYAADEFFAGILEWWDQDPRRNGRVRRPKVSENVLSDPLAALAKQLKRYGDGIEKETIRKDFMSAHDRLNTLSVTLKAWNDHELEDNVYWGGAADGAAWCGASESGGSADRCW